MDRPASSRSPSHKLTHLRQARARGWPQGRQTKKVPRSRPYEAGSSATEKLVSVDSHVHFTDEWVKAARLRKEMHAVWDDANRKAEDLCRNGAARRPAAAGGSRTSSIRKPSKDPGHFNSGRQAQGDGSRRRLCRGDLPELAGAKIINPNLMGDDWKEVFQGYNNAMADFAAHDPVRLMTAYQLPLYDIDFALKEVERLARDKKARCVQLTPFPSDLGLPDLLRPALRAAVVADRGNRPDDPQPSRSEERAVGRVPSRPDAAEGHLHRRCPGRRWPRRSACGSSPARWRSIRR